MKNKLQKYKWLILPVILMTIVIVINAFLGPDYELNPEKHHFNTISNQSVLNDEIIYIHIVKELQNLKENQIEILSGTFDLENWQINRIKNDNPKLIIADNQQEAIQYQILLTSIGIEKCMIDKAENEVLKYEFKAKEMEIN